MEKSYTLSPPSKKMCHALCHTLLKPFPTHTYIVVERRALDALWGVTL